ncbi:Fungal fruit body lectin [Naviculisporaceae sp. PSN 640]
MAYTITVQVYQTNPNAFFQVVEKTVFANGTWSETNDAHVLSIGASGTSGSLRFVADTGENFIVTLGVHNYAPWGDIVTKLDPVTQTGVKITPEYYETEWGGTGNKDRVAARWKTLASYEVSRDGRKYGYKYTVTEGNNLKVKVTIG